MPTFHDRSDEVKSPAERLAWLTSIQRADIAALAAHLPKERRPRKGVVVAIAAALVTVSCGGAGRCWQSLSQLAGTAGVARSTVQVVLALFVRAGWLSAAQRAKVRRRDADTTVYSLRWPDGVPIPESGIGVPESGIGVPEQIAEVYRSPVTKEESSKEESKARAWIAGKSAVEVDRLYLIYRRSADGGICPILWPAWIIRAWRGEGGCDESA